MDNNFSELAGQVVEKAQSLGADQSEAFVIK